MGVSILAIRTVKVKDQNSGNLDCAGVLWGEHRGLWERQEEEVTKKQDRGRWWEILRVKLRRVSSLLDVVRNLQKMLFLEKAVAKSDLCLAKISGSYY